MGYIVIFAQIIKGKEDTLGALTIGHRHAARAGHLLAVPGVDIVLQLGVLLVLAEARRLFLQLSTAGGGGRSRRQDGPRA